MQFPIKSPPDNQCMKLENPIPHIQNYSVYDYSTNDHRRGFLAPDTYYTTKEEALADYDGRCALAREKKQEYWSCLVVERIPVTSESGYQSFRANCVRKAYRAGNYSRKK